MVQEETAFAFGPSEFTGPRWGWWNDVEVCCEEPPPDDCREPVGYYQELEIWPAESPWSFCWNEEVGGLGQHEIMDMEPTTLFIVLSQEYIAAKQNGTCFGFNCVMGDVMVEGNNLLDDCEVSADAGLGPAQAGVLARWLQAEHAG